MSKVTEKMVRDAMDAFYGENRETWPTSQKRSHAVGMRRALSAALAAAKEQEPVANGWVMVPRQMTTDMMGAYHHSVRVEKYLPAIWDAILAACPSHTSGTD